MRFMLLGSALLFGFVEPRSGHAAGGGSDEVRAIWVTRFEYRTEADVRTIVANCAATGFNTILFQVRGQADAYYRSEIEPWAERLGGRDPGFDPLETACREAKRRGIKLHAWINALPAWRGVEPPKDRTHIARRRPDWLVAGKDGRPQAYHAHYVALNPCLPEVRDYVADVVRDIVSRYDVDGLHLDYIRFIEGDWSYDARTLKLFRSASGATPAQNPAAWAAFRRDAVSELVRQLRRVVGEARPRAVLSAAIFPSAASRERVLQDAENWVRRGWVDWVFPMTYEDSSSGFREVVEDGYRRFSVKGGEACIPGVGAYRHKTVGQTLGQLELCRGGFALFSYSSLWVSPDETRAEDARLCRLRREALTKYLAR
jgi:uncharacterized lipoprotein YddW (UPF0748 family)